jgi:hypothetical protein
VELHWYAKFCGWFIIPISLLRPWDCPLVGTEYWWKSLGINIIAFDILPHRDGLGMQVAGWSSCVETNTIQ